MPIVVTKLTKSFGDKMVLENFSHTFPDRGLTALMGPSGVGKTTLSGSFWGWKRQMPALSRG